MPELREFDRMRLIARKFGAGSGRPVSGRGSGVLLCMLLAVGCGGPAEPRTVTIVPAGNDIRYGVTEFTVEVGTPVRIELQNVASAPAMRHNVVVLRDRDAIDRVGLAAVQVGADGEYVPEDDAIIAYTPMADPGDTVVVSFMAPGEPGTYPFICTFPGHYRTMQGAMHVVE